MVKGLDSTKITDSFLIFLNKNVQGTNWKHLSNMPYPQFMFYCRNLENNLLYPSYLEPVTITKLFFFLFLTCQSLLSVLMGTHKMSFTRRKEKIFVFFLLKLHHVWSFFFFFSQQGWLKAPYSSKVDISLSKNV